MSIEQKLDLILAKISAIEARAPAESISLSAKEAAQLAGCKSLSAFYRFAEAAELKAYRQGKYRRADVVAAINRMSLKAI